MKRVRFDSDDMQNALASLSDDEIDNLMFGAIELDADGTILRYNLAESELTGRRPEDVIGRNFFNDVAPCTRSNEFSGRFFRGVETGEFNAVFEYVFDYEMAPTKVRILMIKSAVADTYWLLIKRKFLETTEGDEP
ncbi:photoactive yellow protein [Marinobacter sp. C2H3]|uniref:photoactive yellow protein n=1 Tax=Marinobacter sp. C2H3 TaxID=3119003 RepID=UPI00300EEB86